MERAGNPHDAEHDVVVQLPKQMSCHRGELGKVSECNSGRALPTEV